VPILPDFILTGTALFALPSVVGNQLDPGILPVKTLQMVGVLAPFKAQPERRQSTKLTVLILSPPSKPSRAVDRLTKNNQ
jgi:hypothetical protein